MEANTRPKQNEPVLFDSTHTARSEFTASRFNKSSCSRTSTRYSHQHTRHKQIQTSTHATSRRKKFTERTRFPFNQLKLTDEKTLQEPIPAAAPNQQGMLQLLPENQFATPLPLYKGNRPKITGVEHQSEQADP
jgi:hypothetical protein